MFLKGNPDGDWSHDMYEGGPRKTNPRLGAAPTAAGGSSKLVVSNLDFGVSDADIKVLLEVIFLENQFYLILHLYRNFLWNLDR